MGEKTPSSVEVCLELHKQLPCLLFIFLVSIQPLDNSMNKPHCKVFVKSLEEIRKEKQRLKQQQEKSSQEEQVIVPSAREERAEGKAPASTSPKSPVTTGNTGPLAKRLLVRSQEIMPENLGSGDLDLSAQSVERRAKGKKHLYSNE